jgi:aspartate/methionine/tyrosine aminotransferase
VGSAAGDPATVAAYADYNRMCGVSTPAPVTTVATALWSDDGHVAAARSELAANWALADELLRDVPGYRRADAGFFVWLPVADGERAARRVWRDQALFVMPGRYLAGTGRDGTNPGAGYLRIALVHERPLMCEALTRLRNAIGEAVR